MTLRQYSKKRINKTRVSLEEIIFLFFLFIFSLIPRLFLLKGINYSSDDMHYCKVASFIVYGGFSEVLKQEKDYLWTFSVGWPFILGYICKMFSLGLHDVLSLSPCIVNAFFSSFSVILTYFFIKEFWKNKIAGAIGSMLFMFNLIIFSQGTSALAHTSGLLFFISCLYFAYLTVNYPLWYNFLGFYVFLGLAILVRYPNYAIPVVIFLWVLVSHRKGFKKLFLRWEHLFSLLSLIIVFPQLVYNKKFHGSYFSSGYTYYRHFEQASQGRESFLFRMDTFLAYLLQWRFISPFLIFFVMYAIYRLYKNKEFSKLVFLSIWFFSFFFIYCYTIPMWCAGGSFTWFPGYILLILGAGGIFLFFSNLQNKTLLFIITSLIFISHSLLSFYINRFTLCLGKLGGEMPFAFSMGSFISLSLKSLSIYHVPGFPNIFPFYIWTEYLLPLYVILFIINLILKKKPIFKKKEISLSLFTFFIPILISLTLFFVIKDFGTKTLKKYEGLKEEIDKSYTKGNFKDVISKIDYVTSLFSYEDINLLEIKGNCLYNIGKIDEALKEWRKIGEKKYTVAYKGGLILFEKQRFKEAKEFFFLLANVIKNEYYIPQNLDPEFVEYAEKSIFLIGECFIRLKEEEKAKEYFNFLKEKSSNVSLVKLCDEKLKLFDKK